MARGKSRRRKSDPIGEDFRGEDRSVLGVAEHRTGSCSADAEEGRAAVPGKPAEHCTGRCRNEERSDLKAGPTDRLYKVEKIRAEDIAVAGPTDRLYKVEKIRVEDIDVAGQRKEEDNGNRRPKEEDNAEDKSRDRDSRCCP